MLAFLWRTACCRQLPQLTLERRRRQLQPGHNAFVINMASTQFSSISNKDMGEIGAAQDVWEAKINLCWWHLRRSVRTRLAKAKLATSPYNVNWAMAEFTFIKPNFIPPGTGVHIDDYKGGIPDSELLPLDNAKAQATQSAAPYEHSSQHQPPPPFADATNFLRIKLPLPRIALAIGRVIQGKGFRLSIPAAHLPTIGEQE